MTRKTFLTALDHSGLGIMNVIPYAIHPGATLMMEIVKVSSAVIARLTTVPTCRGIRKYEPTSSTG